MVNRILSLVGWLGFALVLVSVAIRFGYPAKDQYAVYAAWAGLVCVLAYILGQWREIAAVFGRRQARYGTLAGRQRARRPRHPGRDQLHRRAAEQAVGSDGEQAVQPLGSDPQRPREARRAAAGAGVRAGAGVPALPGQAEGVRVRVEASHDRVHRSRQEAGPRQGERDSAVRHDRLQLQGPHRAGDVRHRAGHHQRHHQGRQRPAEEGVLHPRATASGTPASSDRDGYKAIATALEGENYGVDKVVLAQQGVADDAAVVVVAGRGPISSRPRSRRSRSISTRPASCCSSSTRRTSPDSPPLTNLIALAHDWGMDVGNDVVVDVSGMGRRLIGTDASVPVAANYPSASDHVAIHVPDRVPAGAIGHAGCRRRQRPHGADVHRDEPAQLGGDRHQEPADDRRREAGGGQGRQEGPGLDCRDGPEAAAPAPPKPGGSPTPRSPETRVAVIGDSDFAANAGLGIQGNRDLFMNTIGWLSQQENLISIRPKEPDDRRITMTAAQQSNLTWFVLLVIPGCIFGTGVYTWWRRRS